MEKILIYILQVNVLLTVVYLGYVLLLKGLTFYQLNRGYFLIGMLFSFVYPFLDIKSWFTRHVEPVGELMEYIPMYTASPAPDHLYSINNALLFVFSCGAVFFLLRLLIHCASVWRIHLRSSSALWRVVPYRNVRFPVAPFSFLRQIYVHRNQHDEQELTHIFKHELVHTNGLHTADILFIEMVNTICWYNPMIRLLRKAIHQNLEFLTDQQVLNMGIDRQDYQYSLLHVNRAGVATPITNKFNFKMLKQRIMMMNKKRSSKLELSKYAMLIPAVIFAAAALTVNTVEANIEDAVEKGKISVVRNDFFKNKLSLTDTAGLCLDNILGGERFAMVESLDPRAKGLTKVEAPYADTTLVIVKDDASRKQDGDPLYVVDGIEMLPKDYKKINPNDIERIDVLKNHPSIDAYGEKGKNGVVLITTKGAEAESLSQLSNKDKPDPLYILDGKRISKNDLNDLVSPNDIKEMQIWKDEQAVERYGERGRNGVILITSKDAQSKTKKVIKSDIFQKDSTIVKIVKGSNAGKPKPLYVLDGVPQSNGNLDAIDPNSIENISVLKDNSALAIYGEKAKDGVVLISTKNFNRGTKVDEKETSHNQDKQPGTPTGLFGSPETWSKKNSPIVIVDGEIQKTVDVKKINAKEVVNIRKLTGKAAIDKYGKEAINGAVEVTTKAATGKSDAKK